MKKAFVFLFTWVLVLGVFVGKVQAQFMVPSLQAPVNDYAQLLPRSAEQVLNQMLRELHQQTGVQLTVLTIDSLEGTPIEMASIEVVDAWKLGDAQSDKGLLLFISQQDRKIRIEVGQGLEGSITDAHSRRIIDEMADSFRASDFGSGTLVGVARLVRLAEPDFPVEKFLAGGAFLKRDIAQKKSQLMLGFFIFFFFIVILLSRFGLLGSVLTLLAAGHRGQMGGGFGGGFGGRGGGGWSGGGGGFSGGGASGGW